MRVIQARGPDTPWGSIYTYGTPRPDWVWSHGITSSFLIFTFLMLSTWFGDVLRSFSLATLLKMVRMACALHVATIISQPHFHEDSFARLVLAKELLSICFIFYLLVHHMCTVCQLLVPNYQLTLFYKYLFCTQVLFSQYLCRREISPHLQGCQGTLPDNGTLLVRTSLSCACQGTLLRNITPLLGDSISVDSTFLPPFSGYHK